MNTANRVLDELYFITTTVVDWVDIFTRPKYKHIMVADIMRDFKKFTGKRILAELEEDPQESRREWMLDRFRFAGIG